jgi:hypothetical protein
MDNQEGSLKSEKGNIAENDGPAAPANLPPDSELPKSKTEESTGPKKLTPEEQMALYESDLKENDWGHQPC